MPTCKITIKDEVRCFVTGLAPTNAEYLWDKLGIHEEGYFFAPAFKYGKWDGKIRFFEKTGRTFVRLLPEIIEYLAQCNYEFDLVDERPVPPVISTDFGKITARDKHGYAIEAEGCDFMGPIILPDGAKFELRPYQLDVLIKLVEAGSGFALCSTGSGKTSITAALSYLYSQAGLKVITIVPSSDLVAQTSKWYRLLNIDTGIFSGTEKDLDHLNIVATWQTIQNRPEILADFQVVIWDEAHGIRGDVAGKLLNDHAKNAAFRFGVTGTFPKPKADKYRLMSAVGQIICEIPAWWLIEMGYLAKIDIQEIELNERYIEEEFPSYDSETSFLSKSIPRMEKIADLIVSQAAVYGNTLVLVNSISFGKKLSALIKDSVFLYGESAQEERLEQYDMFDTHDGLIVIASSGIASTGISIDRVFCMFMVDPKKSFIKAIQSIGRGLRIGRDKKYIKVFDVHSKLKWAKKHFKERKKWYTEALYPVLKKIVVPVDD